MGFGNFLALGGHAGRGADQAYVEGQQMAASRIAMAERMRAMQRDTAGRNAQADMYAPNPTDITNLQVQDLNKSTRYGAPPAGGGATGGGMTGGGMRGMGGASGAGGQPFLGENPARTGVHTGGFNDYKTAPAPGQNPYSLAQMQALRQELGHRNTLDEPPPQFSTTPGEIPGNLNPSPLPDQTFGGVAAQQPVAQQQANQVLSGVAGQQQQQQQPIQHQTGYGGVVNPGPGGPVQEIRGQRAPTRRNIQKMDQMMARLESDYQRMLPHAKEANAGEFLSNIRSQMQQLALNRDQMLLHDSLNELATTGNPDQMVQVMNAMGYDMQVDILPDGRMNIVGPNGEPVAQGEPHEIAGNLRVQMNSEFQQKQREMRHEIRLQQLKTQGDITGRAVTGAYGVAGQRERGVEAENIRAQDGGSRKFFAGQDGNNYITLPDGRVGIVNQASPTSPLYVQPLDTRGAMPGPNRNTAVQGETQAYGRQGKDFINFGSTRRE